jgi:hypothetical protein
MVLGSPRCFFIVPLGDEEKNPRLEARTCVCLKGRENRRMMNKES